MGAAALAAVFAVAGCTTTREAADNPSPMPTYTGPAFLRGTIGSLTTLRGDRPILVSGYGLVVDLHGTGSSEVPAFLRQAMINMLQKRGMGSARLGTQDLTPQRVLADINTSVVAVRGLIPPGAVAGTRFDIIVSALTGTQTTSLADGLLYTTDLTIDGTNPSLPYSKTLATARGSIYVKPLDGADDGDDAADAGDTGGAGGRSGGSGAGGGNANDFIYNAVILSGGTVTQSRLLELTLNQPSWRRSRAIADRINERFPMPPGSTVQTADAQNDLLIRINIPPAYAADPGELITLMQHLFVPSGVDFAPKEAAALLASLVTYPDRATDVMLSCQALGKTVIPVLRQYYHSANMPQRLTALRAGARLEDERASQSLYQVAQSDNPDLRRQAAEALVYLPRSLKGSATLKQLLNDSDLSVRLAAYQSLARINDPIITRGRVMVRDEQGDLKYVIDRVPAKRPLIYVTQQDFPRIVIFDPSLGFKTPMIQGLWHNRLMMRQNAKGKPLSVLYQWPRTRLPMNVSNTDATAMMEGKTYKLQPTVATLAYMLGHHPTMDSPQDGLDLSYSQVVDVLYQLCHSGAIAAPIKIHISALARLINQTHSSQPQRPVAPGQTAPDSSYGKKFQIPAGQTPGTAAATEAQGQPIADSAAPLQMRRVTPGR